MFKLHPLTISTALAQVADELGTPGWPEDSWPQVPGLTEADIHFTTADGERFASLWPTDEDGNQTGECVIIFHMKVVCPLPGHLSVWLDGSEGYCPVCDQPLVLIETE